VPLPFVHPCTCRPYDRVTVGMMMMQSCVRVGCGVRGLGGGAAVAKAEHIVEEDLEDLEHHLHHDERDHDHLQLRALQNTHAKKVVRQRLVTPQTVRQGDDSSPAFVRR
jgi:hypothetical protein